MAQAVVDYRSISWVLGAFLAVLALTMLLPLGFGLAMQHQLPTNLSKATTATLGASVVLLVFGHRRPESGLRQREGILLVVLIWLSACVFGALPFYFSGHFDRYADAFFESASGFTTTGATVVAVVEKLPPELHLWRALTHWLGGMGIVLLSIAILPLIGQGGRELYHGEFSGARSQQLKPRVIEASRTLWRIYLALTLVLFACLLVAGMGVLDAVCHAFSTLATGGFSTRTASIGAFDDPWIEYLIIVFMLLGGMSFVQQYKLWVDRSLLEVVRDYEVRAYFVIVSAAALAITVVLVLTDEAYGAAGLEYGFRTALFQAASIMTTTGFVTADYAAWPPVLHVLLLSLMFIGGCTGSTAGGLKVARLVLMLQVVKRDFLKLSEPRGIFRIHLGGNAIPELTVSAMLNLAYLALMVMLVGSLLVTATGVDLLTAFTAVVACQFNVGPGLGGVGPAGNYGELSAAAKGVLALCMIAGRLEFYTFLFVATRAFWRP
jgi:trk system potassium uptake protein TrkH